MIDLIVTLMKLGGSFLLFLFVYKMIKSILDLRVVVNTNEVHIVQTGKKAVSYGKDMENGNVYYEWPSWLPIIGIQKTILPLSVFKITLDSYDAYDKDRVPFEVDVVAFFRVENSNMAAQRVYSFNELQQQLVTIVQGAVRTVLAKQEIDSIMTERSTFGDQFTNEVKEQLKDWGVTPVKNLELMDIRDSQGNKVIANIMEKRKSFIEKESRIEVAKNKQEAEQAEILSLQTIEIQKQEAKQKIGERQALQEKEVGIAKEKSSQEIKEQARLTAEKDMEIKRVNDVKLAEITKQKEVIKAEQDKQTTILLAEAELQRQQKEAEAIKVVGEAKADAEKAIQLAPVEAQIVLAKEIGSNKEYQTYLITLEQVKASQTVGVAQATNLGKADIKIIANTGSEAGVSEGIKSVGDFFSPKGGTAVGGMLEAFANTNQGKALIDKFITNNLTDK